MRRRCDLFRIGATSRRNVTGGGGAVCCASSAAAATHGDSHNNRLVASYSWFGRGY
jgi:hypothetical protein